MSVAAICQNDIVGIFWRPHLTCMKACEGENSPPRELGEMVLTTVLAALLSISFADAAVPNAMLRGRPRIPRLSVPDRTVTSLNGTALPPLTTVYYFDQLIDHTNPRLGTFQQRYWMDWEFYEDGMSLSFPLSVPGRSCQSQYI